MTKASRPTITIHNVTTDEILVREMNDDEFAQYQLDQQSELERQAAEAQKATDKAALLAQLGITEEQAALLLS